MLGEGNNIRFVTLPKQKSWSHGRTC